MIPSRCYRDWSALGNSAHSCLSKASFTFAGGFPETVAPGFGMIQTHALHPQAAKLRFSSHTSSLPISTRLLAGCAVLNRLGLDSRIRYSLYSRRSPMITHYQDQNWISIAEQVTVEMDSAKLAILLEQLCG